jgi:DNA-binding NtrC family response regulator
LSENEWLSQVAFSMQPTILIVDDEKHTRDGLRRLLENDYDVYIAADIAGAMDVLEREQIDLLLTDLRLGSEDGMQLIERALKMPHAPICIMMTAYGSVDTAVEAMKRGAYDFVTKPLNLDKVEILIARALQNRKLEQENRSLRQEVNERYGLENILGESLALREVLDTIRQVAPSSANVLLEGESGTGKELAAHAIHNLSRRNKARFVVVHCAALSPQLLESELFGHEKGAFTGASERRIGRFEQGITMPPLRERKEDIPLLVRSFLRHFCKANDKPLLELTADAMNTLLTYDWPGNVRELRTAIEHGVVMATGPKITVRDLPMAVRQAAGASLPRGISATKAFGEKASPLDLHETERKLILQALATTNGNVTAAAKKLGISRRTLHRKINELNAEKEQATSAVSAEQEQSKDAG